VDWRVRNFVVVIVHYFELFQHVVHSTRERDLFISMEMIEDILSGHVLVSYFQWDHIERNVSFQSKHLIKGMSIKKDVELCSWTYISLTNCSTHYHNLIDLLLNVRISQQ
jgi:hypothetical protein